MVSVAAVVSVALMVLVGVGTAGFLAYMLRDLVAQLADGPAERATRVVLVGPVLYLVGFGVVLAGLFVGPSVLTGVGIAVIVLAAAPMAAGLYLARTGR